MSEVKNEGLEVCGVRAIVTDAFVSMIEAALGMKAPDCAPPAFIQSAIDRAIDRINSEALAGYADRDARIAELEGLLRHAQKQVPTGSGLHMRIDAALAAHRAQGVV